jgi:hypothetical protein
MFNLNEIELKLVILTVIAIIIGSGIYDWHLKNVKIAELQKIVTVQKIENDAMKNELAQKNAIAKVNEQANVAIIRDTAVVNTTHNAVISKMKSKIAKVEVSYKDKTDPVSKAKEDTETSTIMINGLWEEYCDNNPNNANCKTNS